MTTIHGVWRMTLIACLVVWTAGAQAELKPGTVLNQDTSQEADGLLPPEISQHYKKGEYANPVVGFQNSAFQWDDGFAEATQWNREHLVLDADKQPVDKSTGKRPSYITGFPFPDIREDDPDAGIKVIWNLLYQVYTGGNIHTVSSLDWLSRTGLDRSAGQDGYFFYYDGQPKQYIPENPQNFLSQFLSVTTTPADLQGTAALSHRFKDPNKRDLNWAYVPAMRRIRAVSPANRSDGFLGSDMSQDDGNFFDGKPEDFTWKLVGQRDALRLTDPDALAGKVVRQPLPGGGWRTPFANNDRSVGFQVKDWKESPGRQSPRGSPSGRSGWSRASRRTSTTSSGSWSSGSMPIPTRVPGAGSSPGTASYSTPSSPWRRRRHPSMKRSAGAARPSATSWRRT
jgi:hypothetical protein